MTQTQTNQTPQIYVYTQHVQTVRLIGETCKQKITVLEQDRTRDPVEDVLRQLPPEALQGATLYAVLPIDKAVELKTKTPQLKILLLQLDGAVIEKLTGKPYDPKSEYPPDIVRQALRIVEVKGGTVKYTHLEGMAEEIAKKGITKIAVFNDNVREGLKMALGRLGFNLELVKVCNGDNCVEVNPLGYKSGYRISFPGIAGRLTPEQIADMLIAGTARIYYVDIDAETVPLCA
jgi:hypothetical protein